MTNTNKRRRPTVRQFVCEEEQQLIAETTKQSKDLGEGDMTSYLESIKMCQKIYDCTFDKAKKILHNKRMEKLVQWEFKNLG